MPSIELADLQQRVYGRLGSNTLLYPLPEVTRSINYAIACLNAHTGMLQGTLSGGTTTANCLIYPVPAGILVPFAVRFGGVSLRRCSVDAANLRWQTWMSHTSAGYGSVDSLGRVELRLASRRLCRRHSPEGYRHIGAYSVSEPNGCRKHS